MSNLSARKYLFRPEKQLELQKALGEKVAEALAASFQSPITTRVHQSSIQHTVLEPEGEQFTIMVRVTVHPKKTAE